MKAIRNSLIEASGVLQEFMQEQNVREIAAMARVLLHCFRSGGKVLICGNGGSACDAMHFAEELTGRFRKIPPALPAIPLTDAAHLTCVANDWAFAHTFSRHIAALGKPEDILIALSTSGDSENIVRAVEQAKQAGMGVILLLGKSGGHVLHKGDFQLVVPSQCSERIQEIHMMVLHILVETVEREMYPENYED